MPSHPSNVLVSGAINFPAINGIYVTGPAYNGKNSYVLNDGVNIFSIQYINNNGVTWVLTAIQGIYGGDLFSTQSDVEYPWLATTWDPEADPDTIVITEMPVSNTLGLSGVKYEGYFDGDPQWFTTATRTSATELRSNFNPVFPIPENGYSWQWTGYFKPLPGPAGEIEDDFTFTMGSDDIGIMWVGNVALSGYTTANRTVSAYGYDQSAPISLRADTYYPVRIQFGHPVPPTAVSLQIQANPTLRQANDFVFGNLFNVAGGDGGISEFQRVANLHGGVANFLRLRLLGQF